MSRPWFGICPYCGHRMTFGLHARSWGIGTLVGGIVMIVMAVLR